MSGLPSGVPWDTTPTPPMALPAELLDDFRRWMVEDRGFSPSTVRTRVSTVEQYTAYLRLRRQRMERATHEDVRGFLKRYDNTRTRNRVLADLRGFYSWAIDEGKVKPPNPCRRVYRAQEPKSLPRPLAVTVATALLKAATPGRAVTAIAVMLYAGLRVSEVCNLQWENISATALHVVGKGNKERYVPVSDTLRRILERWARTCIREYGDLPELVFPGQYVYKPVTAVTLWQDVKDAAAKVGVYCTPHMLRHTFCTELYRGSNHDLVGVATVAGHASVVTTQRYALVTAQEMQANVEALDFG